MPRVRALTLVLEDPSAAAQSLSRILGWAIDQDRGSFASLVSENSVPLWINAPAEGQDISCNLILHIEADDVDVAFQRAVDDGAEPVREPTDMDFGERSACVTTAATPGMTIDFSRPLN